MSRRRGPRRNIAANSNMIINKWYAQFGEIRYYADCSEMMQL